MAENFRLRPGASARCHSPPRKGEKRPSRRFWPQSGVPFKEAGTLLDRHPEHKGPYPVRRGAGREIGVAERALHSEVAEGNRASVEPLTAIALHVRGGLPRQRKRERDTLEGVAGAVILSERVQGADQPHILV